MVPSDEVDESYLKKRADAGDPEACNRLGEYFLGKASETTLSFTPEDELGIDVQIKDLERQKEFFNLKANEAFDYHPSGFTDDWEEGVRYWDNRRGECIDKIKELEEKKQCYEQERLEVDSTRDAYLKRSFEYFEKSALRRDPEGMWNTGWRYWQGEGTPKKDENSAVTWWKQAAEHISARGAFLHAPESFPEGTRVRLALAVESTKIRALTGVESLIKVEGKVVRSNQTGMAVCFDEGYQILGLKSL